MSRKDVVAPASALPIAEALRASAPLGRLAERLRESNALFAAVGPLLPPGLAAHMRAGPIDEAGWSILCANAAVAAKLRQIVPLLQQHLHESGRVIAAIRVKVQPA
ncbi:MAG: DciA family protein [Caldimonas sp.]